MSEATTADVEALASGLFFVALDPADETTPVRRISSDALAATQALAATAVQPGDLGSAAFLTTEELQDLIDAQLGGIATLLQEING